MTSTISTTLASMWGHENRAVFYTVPRTVPRTVSRTVLAAFLAMGAVLAAGSVQAAPRGSEFDTTLGPASGGMEGVAVARPQDATGMLFANPGTLTQLQGDNEFLVGATFVSPDLDAKGPPTDLFGGAPNQAPLTGPFNDDSRLNAALAPNVAALQRFSDRFVAGFGFAAISGLGGDFRNVEGLPNLVSDLKIFGANTGAAYQVTDRLSVGAVGTLALANLQIGLTDSGGETNNFGVGGTAGATYDTGPLVLGLAYKSELSVTYDQVIETAPDSFEDLELEQPREVQVGIATSPALLPDSLIAAEFRWKNWSNAETYNSFWNDQFIGSLGLQHRFGSGPGAVTLRGGYSYSSNIRVDESDLGNSFGKITQVAAPDNSGSLPVTPTFLELAQATIADGFWRQSLSAGFGIQVTDLIRFDFSGSFGFDGEEDIGRFESDGTIWQIGGGLTWTF